MIKEKGGTMKGKIQQAMVAALILFSLLLTSSNLAWAEGTIIDEWADVRAPKAPELKPVSVDPDTTALLVLDIEKLTCNSERRPRCIASVPRI